jgi:Flp pilus assembly protein protease CpaA
MGGGDIKLLVVLTLMDGWEHGDAGNFFSLTAVFGGVLVVCRAACCAWFCRRYAV